MYHSLTDEHLFLLLEKGDEEALAELYERYKERLMIKANLLLNSKEEAEELVDDIFLDLWEKRHTRVISHTFRTYVASMLKYKSFKVLGDRKYQQKKQITFEKPETVDLSTQHWIEFVDLREKVDAIISRLPEKCRVIFRLKREQGYSVKEIAEKLGVSVNTVHTQLYRALNRLKTSLKSFSFHNDKKTFLILVSYIRLSYPHYIYSIYLVHHKGVEFFRQDCMDYCSDVLSIIDFLRHFLVTWSF